MPITSAAPRSVSIEADSGFHKALVLVNGIVPFSLMVLDAYRHRLGVNPVNAALHTTGMLGLLFLLLSLTVTPIRRLTGWSRIVAVRRTLGLYAFFYVSAHLIIFGSSAGSVGVKGGTRPSRRSSRSSHRGSV